MLPLNRPRRDADPAGRASPLISWTIFNSSAAPATSGRGLVVLMAFVPAFVAWLVWTFWSCAPDVHDARPVRARDLRRRHPDRGSEQRRERLHVRRGHGRGGTLRVAYGLDRWPAWRAAAVGVGSIIYDRGALGVLAYALGFAATRSVARTSASHACGSSRPSCCWRRRSARTRSSCEPRDSKSRRGSRATSTTCSRTRSPAS